MKSLEQLRAEWEACHRASIKAAKDWKRYKAFFGHWHRSTQRQWQHLRQCWAAGDVAFQAYVEAHRLHCERQLAQIRSTAWQ